MIVWADSLITLAALRLNKFRAWILSPVHELAQLSPNCPEIPIARIPGLDLFLKHT